INSIGAITTTYNRAGSVGMYHAFHMVGTYTYQKDSRCKRRCTHHRKPSSTMLEFHLHINSSNPGTAHTQPYSFLCTVFYSILNSGRCKVLDPSTASHHCSNPWRTNPLPLQGHWQRRRASK